MDEDEKIFAMLKHLSKAYKLKCLCKYVRCGCQADKFASPSKRWQDIGLKLVRTEDFCGMIGQCPKCGQIYYYRIAEGENDHTGKG